MSFTFPYPQKGTADRGLGNGCTSCVHGTYCPALYWYKRFNEPVPSPANGTACLSWSNNSSDIVGNYPPTQDDLNQIQYYNNVQSAGMSSPGISTEPNRLPDEEG